MKNICMASTAMTVSLPCPGIKPMTASAKAYDVTVAPTHCLIDIITDTIFEKHHMFEIYGSRTTLIVF